MERLEFDLLFRWFVGLGIDDLVWDHSTFSKNRDRLLAGDGAAKFLSAVLAERHVKRLLSSEHFSVDGTPIQAWASMKSFKPIDGPGEGSGPDEPPPASGGRNAEADFRVERRSNATHASTTDPDAKLYRKGPGMDAKLAFLCHALMESRSGLVVDACLTKVCGHAGRGRHWRLSNRMPTGRCRSRSELTAATTLPTSSTSCDRRTCARRWPRTSPAALATFESRIGARWPEGVSRPQVHWRSICCQRVPEQHGG